MSTTQFWDEIFSKNEEVWVLDERLQLALNEAAKYFGPLEVSKLRCPPIDTRPNQRQGRAKLCVAIALNDLGGDIRSL